ncbi:MAG: aminopeptidase [Saprospiraceae bacterium]
MKWISKYAELLVDYSLYLKEGELVYLRTTSLANDLVNEFSKYCIQAGAILEVEIEYEAKEENLMAFGYEKQLEYFPQYKLDLISKCDAYLVIKAPYKPKDTFLIDPVKEKLSSKVLTKFQEIYFDRLGSGSLKRSLCQFPTIYGAEQANMSIEDYTSFIVKACKIDLENPAKGWKELSNMQQRIVDYLNQVQHVVYSHNDWKIEFNVKDRIWINSDGKSNMPSGEVFTSPVENSVCGTIYFDYPTIMYGEDVQGIKLQVQDGYITEYSAKIGQSCLDKVFAVEGSRYFGEVAIGTNKEINQATKNILFDEKIGGTIHMAVGQSYYQCGGKNKSTIHWDLITDMKKGGKIIADGKLIYENGNFII